MRPTIRDLSDEIAALKREICRMNGENAALRHENEQLRVLDKANTAFVLKMASGIEGVHQKIKELP